ncbi:hypothetical protein DI396_05640 [Litorivita pollutaquae]|uniref:Uncharacterized protein n=1 Tax=Litorivita pollutaquae TaxID=2200892 RepID=A0A2V4NPT7_9RHOB|nr:hypothetical protein DI396_05640 [Litorivita pollutaquae]
MTAAAVWQGRDMILTAANPFETSCCRLAICGLAVARLVLRRGSCALRIGGGLAVLLPKI